MHFHENYGCGKRFQKATAARIRNYYCADFHLKDKKKKTVIFAVTSEFSTMLKKKEALRAADLESSD